jgi:hypothetical protein
VRVIYDSIDTSSITYLTFRTFVELMAFGKAQPLLYNNVGVPID